MRQGVGFRPAERKGHSGKGCHAHGGLGSCSQLLEGRRPLPHPCTVHFTFHGTQPRQNDVKSAWRSHSLLCCMCLRVYLRACMDTFTSLGPCDHKLFCSLLSTPQNITDTFACQWIWTNITVSRGLNLVSLVYLYGNSLPTPLLDGSIVSSLLPFLQGCKPSLCLQGWDLLTHGSVWISHGDPASLLGRTCVISAPADGAWDHLFPRVRDRAEFHHSWQSDWKKGYLVGISILCFFENYGKSRFFKC